MKIEMKREQTEACSSLPSGGDLSKEPLIQLNRIQVGYDGKQVLRDIDLNDEKPEPSAAQPPGAWPPAR